MLICPECGARQHPQARWILCSHCHQRVPVDLTLCPHCGRDLRPSRLRLTWWSGGLALIALWAAWTLGHGPVQQFWQRVTHAPERLMTLVQIPDVPTATATPLPVRTATQAASPRPTGSGTGTSTRMAAASATVMPTPTATVGTRTPTVTATPRLTYRVQDGDSLITIGINTGIPWETIAQVNGITEYTVLHIGDELKLPTPTGAPTARATATAAAQPSVTRNSTGTVSPTPAVTSTAAVTASARPSATAQATSTATVTATPYVYRVVSGDSLASIGEKLGVAWEDIAAANGLTASSILQIGQALIIPGKR
jgi:LysM repeat protein